MGFAIGALVRSSNGQCFEYKVDVLVRGTSRMTIREMVGKVMIPWKVVLILGCPYFA